MAFRAWGKPWCLQSLTPAEPKPFSLLRQVQLSRLAKAAVTHILIFSWDDKFHFIPRVCH